MVRPFPRMTRQIEKELKEQAEFKQTICSWYPIAVTRKGRFAIKRWDMLVDNYVWKMRVLENVLA